LAFCFTEYPSNDLLRCEVFFSLVYFVFLTFDCYFCCCRKIVLATNIAESSITIDDVVYVIDCGKAKETSYDALNKLACLLPSWISKASAHQVLKLFNIFFTAYLLLSLNM